MQIDGELEGDIHCQSSVIISSSGQVKGEIHAEKVIINGVFTGVIFASTIEILPQGKAQGVVHTDNLCIERGGSFLGETHSAQSPQQSLLLSEPPAASLQVTLNETN